MPTAMTIREFAEGLAARMGEMGLPGHEVKARARESIVEDRSTLRVECLAKGAERQWQRQR